MRSEARPAEIRALSGARALPPLVLVLFHYCEQRGYFGVPAVDLFVGKGYLWVEFFFGLSGFILIHVYGGRAASLFRPRNYLTFLQTRLARLYPLHLATLLLLLALVLFTRAIAPLTGQASIFDQPYHPIVSPLTFVANLFLVQAWNLFPYLSWNAPAWFVSAELLLCLLLLLLEPLLLQLLLSLLLLQVPLCRRMRDIDRPLWLGCLGRRLADGQPGMLVRRWRLTNDVDRLLRLNRRRRRLRDGHAGMLVRRRWLTNDVDRLLRLLGMRRPGRDVQAAGFADWLLCRFVLLSLPCLQPLLDLLHQPLLLGRRRRHHHLRLLCRL